jgi:hypothetical protein
MRSVFLVYMLNRSFINGNKKNDSNAEIGMNFAYIAINVRNFNSKADFRENATSYIHGS